jgi:hypothetical protein
VEAEKYRQKADFAMKKGSNRKKIRIATVLETIFVFITLPLSLAFLSREFDDVPTDIRQLRVILIAVFFAMAMTRLFRAWRFSMIGKPKLLRIQNLIYAGLYLAGSVLPVFMTYTQGVGLEAVAMADESRLAFIGDLRQPLSLIFWMSLFIGRIIAMIRNHKARSLVLNILLCILILVMALVSFVSCEMMIPMFVIIIQSLVGIFAVVFRRIHMDTLRKIIRKTYASEIIVGLLMLICAFSYVFMYTEPALGKYEDGLWYCFAIVTTIGFGDFTAVSLIGRILSVILGIYGIVVVALITSIIVNFYGEVRREPEEDEEEAAAEKAEEAGQKLPAEQA